MYFIKKAIAEYLKKRGLRNIGLILIMVKSRYFNAGWYKRTYNIKGNPYQHYLMEGWKKYYNPSKKFSTIRYLFDNPDVKQSGMNPLVHYERHGRYEAGRLTRLKDDPLAVDVTPDLLREYCTLQDKRITQAYDRQTERLIVYLIPDFDQICGGMMCIANYHHDVKSLEATKGYESILATVPSRNTFPDYTKFDAHGHVYRFSQILKYFTNLKEVIFHIPEYQFEKFLYCLSPEEGAWLSNHPGVKINLMNQNNELMPEPQTVDILRTMVPNLTMTCAHKQYCNDNIRTTYSMPLHYIPADKKIEFSSMPYKEKKDLLLLSPDVNPMKDIIVRNIEKAFPNIKIVIIENMPFKTYLSLLAQAKWVISFGEGFDGYTVESIYSDTISFSVFNDTFFDEDFKKWPNMYDSYEELCYNIVDDMKKLDNPNSYNSFLKEVQKYCHNEFAQHRYEERLNDYYSGNYSIPFEKILAEREVKLAKKPNISIIMITENSDKFLREQLKSIADQTYKCFELIVYDMSSRDNTIRILNEFKDLFKLKLIHGRKNVQFNEAFRRCLGEASGEYITYSYPDDEWYDNRLLDLVTRMDDFEFAFGKCDYIDGRGKYIDGHQAIYVPTNNMSRFYQITDLCGNNLILFSSFIAKKSLVEGAIGAIDDSDIHLGWWISIYAVLVNKGCVYIGKTIQKYRIHGNKMNFELSDNKEFYNVGKKIIGSILNNYANRLSKRNTKILKLYKNRFEIIGIMEKLNLNGIAQFAAMNRYMFSDDLMESFIKYVEQIKM
ncbi:MAG: glycosyltransferase [Candidatus Fimivivens sp.]|nr:glycosyltransferase [Candidatus Fimivivens sp.]